jgi:hypothetical protein
MYKISKYFPFHFTGLGLGDVHVPSMAACFGRYGRRRWFQPGVIGRQFDLPEFPRNEPSLFRPDSPSP